LPSNNYGKSPLIISCKTRLLKSQRSVAAP
jgi:hypothetical protein